MLTVGNISPKDLDLIQNSLNSEKEVCRHIELFLQKGKDIKSKIFKFSDSLEAGWHLLRTLLLIDKFCSSIGLCIAQHTNKVTATLIQKT